MGLVPVGRASAMERRRSRCRGCSVVAGVAGVAGVALSRVSRCRGCWLEGGADEGEGGGEVGLDEVGGDVEDAVAGALQVGVADGVETDAVCVHAAVDFDHETAGGADDIRDVAADDHLPAEGKAETAAAKLGPEQLLGEGWVLAQMMGTSFELAAAPSRLTLTIG